MSGRVATLAAIWVAVVLGLLAIHVFMPQRSGVIALTEVFEPFIVVSGFVTAACALIDRRRWRVVLVAVFVIAIAARYGPPWVSMPASGGDNLLSVVTWNALAGQSDGQRVAAGLGATEADLVGIQELQPEAVAVLEADAAFAARFPYRVLVPDYSVLGVGLLSRHPIVEQEHWPDPPLLRAVVAPEGRAPITVFVAHPLPSRVRSVAGVPLALDTATRDADIAFIRSLIDRELALGHQVVVLGDFNVTEREPAYGDLAHGLRDAHLDAGIGPGLTWRPEPLAFLPFGLLRIDYVLTSLDLAASGIHVDCRVHSDHCAVVAELRRAEP